MVGSDASILTIHVCVGSSCFVRGSDQVATGLVQLVEQQGLAGSVEVVGAFCMERCSMGVTVRVGDAVLAGVSPDDVPAFFAEHVVPRLRASGTVENVGH